MMEPAPVASSYPPSGEPDLVAGTRIIVQSLPPPLSGRSGKVVDFDRASQAYVIAVDGGNPRTIYRENLRIMEDQSVPVVAPKRAAGRPQATRAIARPSIVPGDYSAAGVRPGDQVLLCLEQHQFTLLEVTGIRRVARGDPCSYAMAAVVDDGDIPQWMRKPPPVASSRPKGGSKLPGFRPGDPVYAVWDVDGRWYPGKVREEYGGDKLEIEWLDKDAGSSVVKRSLVCRRTTFEDLRNRQQFVGMLNLASRTGGLKKFVDVGGEHDTDDANRFREEEAKRKSAIAAESLFGAGFGKKLSQPDWDILLRGVQLLHGLGVDGLVHSQKGEVLTIPSGLEFPKPDQEKQVPVWSEEATSMLQSWLGGKDAVDHLTTSVLHDIPTKAALEASLGRKITLPKGPLDIFLPTHV